MPLAPLVMVVAFLARYGAVHEPDEGAAAHTFQLLMVPVPIVAFFAIKWLPRASHGVFSILIEGRRNPLGLCIGAYGMSARGLVTDEYDGAVLKIQRRPKVDRRQDRLAYCFFARRFSQ